MKEAALNVMIPEDLKLEVKMEALKSNMTIRAYVIKALRERIVSDEVNAKNS